MTTLIAHRRAALLRRGSASDATRWSASRVAAGDSFCARCGQRRVALIGALLGAAGLLFAARATALWQIYLGFGVGVGSGVGFAYVTAIGAVQRWYLKGRAPSS